MYNVTFSKEEINNLIDICNFEIARRLKQSEHEKIPVMVESAEKTISIYREIKRKLIVERDTHLCLK